MRAGSQHVEYRIDMMHEADSTLRLCDSMGQTRSVLTRNRNPINGSVVIVPVTFITVYILQYPAVGTSLHTYKSTYLSH